MTSGSLFARGTLSLAGLLGMAGCTLGDDYVITSSSGVGGNGAGGAAGSGGAGGPGACGPDPEAPGGSSCPPQCSVCDGSTCIIECSEPEQCDNGVLCPPDFGCVVECTGYRACRGATIQCPEDYDCKIRCADDLDQSCENAVFQCSEQGRCDLECGSQKQACKDADLNCGQGGCKATCSGNDRPRVNCAADIACCPDPAACPP
jgi:hypothetical protein